MRGVVFLRLLVVSILCHSAWSFAKCSAKWRRYAFGAIGQWGWSKRFFPECGERDFTGDARLFMESGDLVRYRMLYAMSSKLIYVT
jgi:hypothetical protein